MHIETVFLLIIKVYICLLSIVSHTFTTIQIIVVKMSTQLDAFAHRRLAQSSKTLVALLVYPPSSVGFVLKQLQNCLFDFRGVRNVRSHIVCVSASEAEGKNAKK